jgi:fructokinase
MAATIEGLVAGADAGILVMADLNCRPAAIDDPVGYRARLGRILDRVDVVKASLDDLAWLDPGSTASVAAGRLLDRGPVAVLLTDGPRLVRVLTPSGATDLPVPALSVVDTIGAGDAFCGGFLAAWTGAGHGRADLVDEPAVAMATMFAIDVAALTTTRVGAEPPTPAELGRLSTGG